MAKNETIPNKPFPLWLKILTGIMFIMFIGLLLSQAWDAITYYDPLKYECYGESKTEDVSDDPKYEGRKVETWAGGWSSSRGSWAVDYACRIRNGTGYCCEFNTWGNNNKTLFRFSGSKWTTTVTIGNLKIGG